MLLRLRLTVHKPRAPIITLPFRGIGSLLEHIDQCPALFLNRVKPVDSTQKRLKKNEKTCEPLLAVNQFERDLVAVPVGVKANRAVVIRGAFIVAAILIRRLFLFFNSLEAKIVEIVEQLAHVADRPAVWTLIRRDLYFGASEARKAPRQHFTKRVFVFFHGRGRRFSRRDL